MFLGSEVKRVFGLPDSTIVDKNIPKTKFYENLDISAKLKRCFIDEISKIRWRNKIAPSTMNVTKGEQVKEIEVLEITLSGDYINESVLTQIDREVPYHLLFVLTEGNKSRLCIGYKQLAQAGGNAFKVLKYFYSEWCETEQILIKVEASDLDSAYDKIIRTIVGGTLKPGVSIEQAIMSIEQNERVQKKITKLKKQLKTEKQLNKQIEIRDKINLLQSSIE